MTNTHYRTHATRAIVLGVLRAVSLIMVAAGTVMVLNRFIFGLLGMGDLASAWSNWMGAGAWHGVFMGVPLVAVGVALALSSRRLAAWIVRPPGTGCPGCGYATLDEDGRCSECGYR